MEFKVGDVVECLPDEEWVKKFPCTSESVGAIGLITRIEKDETNTVDFEVAIKGNYSLWPLRSLKLIRRAGEPEGFTKGDINHTASTGFTASILTEAAKIAGVDRSEAYGHPLDNHRRIAGLWQAYLDARKPGALTPQDAARMMILLKIARDLHAPKRDNLVDICGYARCLEMIEERASNE